MSINLQKKRKNVAEIYAAMHSTELTKALSEEQSELTKLEERKTVALALKGTLKDYMMYKPFDSEYMDAALEDVTSDLRSLETKIKFTKNLIKVIEALITFKTGK